MGTINIIKKRELFYCFFSNEKKLLRYEQEAFINDWLWNLSLDPSLFPFQTSRPSNYLLKLKKFKGDIECRQQFFELWKLSANSLVAQDLPHPFNRNG